jgi:hypothetical protein
MTRISEATGLQFDAESSAASDLYCFEQRLRLAARVTVAEQLGDEPLVRVLRVEFGLLSLGVADDSGGDLLGNRTCDEYAATFRLSPNVVTHAVERPGPCCSRH